MTPSLLTCYISKNCIKWLLFICFPSWISALNPPNHNGLISNQQTSEITGPDLIISDLQVTVYNLASIQYQYTITNIGTTAANLDGPTSANSDNVSVQAFIVTDITGAGNSIPAGGTIIGVSPLAELAPGESYTSSFNSSPNIVLADYLYLSLQVDWGNVVDECNENNNISYTSIFISDCDGPNLVVSDLSVTSFTSDNIAYSYTIKNIGNQPAPLDGPTDVNWDNVSIQGFLSPDTIFNNGNDTPAGGSILGVSPLGSLAPDETIAGSFQATTTVDTIATPYFLLMVDWGGQLEECDEIGNIGIYEFNPTVTSNKKVTTASIGIYPNPVRDRFFIDAPTAKVEKLTIYNANGQFTLLLEIKTQGMVDVSSLPQGMYLLLLSTSEETKIVMWVLIITSTVALEMEGVEYQ